MKHAIHARRRRRLLAAVPALAMAAIGLYGPGTANAVAVPAVISPGEFYVNYAEPAIQPDSHGKETKGGNGVYGGVGDNARAFDRKHANGNPLAARQLAGLEAKSISTGKNPRQLKQAPVRRSRSC
jgi:immune inhibitor A